MRRIVGGLAALALLALAAPAAAAPGRDPSVQPFDATSLWNTSIGRDARYVPAGLQTPAVGLDLVTVAAVGAGDPVAPVLSPDCSIAGKPRRMPASLALPSTSASQTLAVVGRDGRTVDTWTAARRCGTSVGGRYAGRTRLDGDGVPVGGSVAGLPGIGGALRQDEVTGKVPVRHALAVLVPARRLAAGPAWPAVRSDGTRATPRSGGTIRLGALVALPPAVAARLPVTSPAGRVLVAALRDHGAYVAGVTQTDTVRLRAVRPTAGAPADVLADSRLQGELRAAVAALAVVADNAPGSVGGRGERRAPPAAPLQFGQAPSPAASPRPSPSPSRSPLPASASAPASAGAPVAAAPVAQDDRPGQAPPVAVAAIAVLAVALLVAGLGAGRAATRLFS